MKTTFYSTVRFTVVLGNILKTRATLIPDVDDAIDEDTDGVPDCNEEHIH